MIRSVVALVVGGGVTVDEVRRCAAGPNVLHGRIGRYFRRSEPRERTRRYPCGLLAPLERKNGRTPAGQAGEVCPDGVQRLLSQAGGDAGSVRDEVRGFALAHLDAGSGVLVVDGTTS
ncbi:hypothetical protein [Streptomyces viridosporus]|uniref:hypothetical protein n=1 Tax=Streptomyces viridosporus TaxID=67581 RepID=UPI0009BE6605|nr:hypothetical protein [Streptomyces viridosporus]